MPGTSFLSCKSKLEPLSPPAGSHHTLTAQAGRAIKAFQNFESGDRADHRGGGATAVTPATVMIQKCKKVNCVAQSLGFATNPLTKRFVDV